MIAGRAALIAVLVAGALPLPGCERQPAAVSPEAPIVLRRGNGGDPQTLDPARADDVHAFNVLADLYEGLVITGPDGDLVPGAAAGWEVSNDGLTYTFRLRDDGRWSDGRPVTAADFVAAIRRAVEPATNSPYASLLHVIRGAAAITAGDPGTHDLGIRAADAQTVIVELVARTPALPAILALPVAYPLPPGSDRDDGRYSDPAHFVGNGAYVLSDWRPGDHLRLVRNPLFRAADSVPIDVVEYHAIADPVTELNMYRAGELDITFTVPAGQVPRLRASMADELRIAPTLGLYYLAFDLTEPPLDDGELRRALSMALDRETLVGLLGRGEQAAYGLVPPGMGQYDAARYDWRDLPDDTRRERAREAYARAGYGPSRPLGLRLVYDTGDVVHETLAVAVAAMWRDVLGVDVELDKREWKYFLATREHRAEWDVMRFAWTGDYAHPRTFTGILHSESPQNLPGYASERYDRLLEAAAAADPSEQLERLAEAERAMLGDYPIVPLYFYVSKHLVAPAVGNFRPDAMDRQPTRYLVKRR